MSASGYNLQPNMLIKIPISGQTTDPFWSNYISQALAAIDAHDHSVGKGARLSQSSIQVTGDWDFRTFKLTNTSQVVFSDPTLLNNPVKSSIYFQNGEFFVKDGSGNIIKITNNGGINTALAGGFTGDYALSGAFCRYTDTTKVYEFFNSINQPNNNSLSKVVVGSLEIRSEDQDKLFFGVNFKTTGNITTSYAYTLPNTLPNNPSFLNINTDGEWSYIRSDGLVKLSTFLVDNPETTSYIRLSPTGVPTYKSVVALDKIEPLLENNPNEDSFLKINNTGTMSYVSSGELETLKAIADWTPNTLYKTNNVVTYLGVLWRILTTHTSGSTFDLSKVVSLENGIKIYQQNGHTFVPMQVVRYNGTNWVLAQANSEVNLSDPPAVVWLTQPNYYVVVSSSKDLYFPNHGLTDDTYFLSETTPGAVVAESPSLSNPIFGRLDSNNLHLLNYRPQIINEEMTFGSVSKSDDVDISTRQDKDILIWNQTTAKWESKPQPISEVLNNNKIYGRKFNSWNVIIDENNLLNIGNVVYNVANSNIIDWNKKYHVIELTGDLTISFNNLPNSSEIVVLLINNTSNTINITWPSNIKFDGSPDTIGPNKIRKYMFFKVNTIILCDIKEYD